MWGKVTIAIFGRRLSNPDHYAELWNFRCLLLVISGSRVHRSSSAALSVHARATEDRIWTKAREFGAVGLSNQGTRTIEG
jgi:hypothetical protein